MKNVRRWIVLLVVGAALASCTDDDPTGSGGDTTSTPSGVLASGDFAVTEGEPTPELGVGTWVDLPPSPVGDWHAVNRFPLWDGSGWVESGTFDLPDGTPDLSRRTAYFSIAERRYLELPPLPVEAGLGGFPTGVRVGDALVLVGYDCPATTRWSSQGAEYCAPDDGAGAKIVLVYDFAGGTWRRFAVPDWMRDYRLESPQIIGTHSGKVFLATLATPPVIAEVDLENATWRRLDERLPGSAPSVQTTVCLIDRQVVVVRTPSTLVDRAYGGPIEMLRFDGSSWIDVDEPKGELSILTCGRRGIYVWRVGPATAEVPRDGTLVYFDPGSGLEQVVAEHLGPPDTVMPTSGDVMALPGSWSADPADQARRWVATPFGLVPLEVGTLAGSTVIGDLLVDLDRPRVMRMGVNADGA